MRSTTTTLALIAAFGACVSGARADTYAVETGVEGVVTMYNLTSVERTGEGFGIWEVVISDRFPTIFGPVAYRVNREVYECRTGRYDTTVLREYDRDGKLLKAIESPVEGAMTIVPATASSEMYNRFCEPSRRGVHPAGLPPAQTVERETAFDAYRFGEGRLSTLRP